MSDHEHQQFVRTSLERIETKLDQQIKTTDDHEGRLRNVEQKVWYVGGFGAALAVMLKFFGK